MSDKCAVIMAKVDDQFYMISDKKGAITGRNTVEELNKLFVMTVVSSSGGVVNSTSVSIMSIMLAPKIIATSEDELEDGLISDAGTNITNLHNPAFNTYGVLLNGDREKAETLYKTGSDINRDIVNRI